MSITNFVDPNMIPKSVKIMFGPQFFVLPEGSMVGEKREDLQDRCVYNCLSSWVKYLYEEMVPSMIMPLECLPFSVDTNRFQPTGLTGPKERIWDCVVYVKRRSNELINHAIDLLQSKQLSYKIFQYGSYQESDYLHELQHCKWMLVLDAHESQGFALEEAMSCNVPLLVMDASSLYDETTDGGKTYTYEYLKPKDLKATSVPYWSNECGIKIQTKEDLSQAMDTMMATYHKFSPRAYILQTLSDEVCMKRILEYFSLC
jgi:hypothetical protein